MKQQISVSYSRPNPTASFQLCSRKPFVPFPVLLFLLPVDPRGVLISSPAHCFVSAPNPCRHSCYPGPCFGQSNKQHDSYPHLSFCSLRSKPRISQYHPKLCSRIFMVFTSSLAIPHGS